MRVTGMAITAAGIKELAHACGFELAGVTPALPLDEFARFETWRAAGMAGDMAYLDGHRGDLRADPRHLLPSAQSILCLGKLYNTSHPSSNLADNSDYGRISRYAWSGDYHDTLRAGLERLLARIAEMHGEPFESKLCVDTAPLLERSYARAAGLGWIGKNTCLINQQQGSWFFLGEILLSIPLAPDSPPADRCGTCNRCIDTCPTEAIVPDGNGHWLLDARRCISYLTIEKRGDLPSELEQQTTNHIFGCDICQDICPWNREAPVSADPSFAPSAMARTPALADLAGLSEDGFRRLFRKSAIWRTKYEGFLRNVAVAMGNSGNAEMKTPLTRLAAHSNAVISSAARKALALLPLALLTLGLGAAVPVSPGYDHFYNNEFDQALTYFEQQVTLHPADPQMYNHIAQTILYREMLRDGALESQLVTGNNPFLRRPKMEIDPRDKQRFAECLDRSTQLSEATLQTDPHNIEALSALAVAHGLRSNYGFVVEKSWMESLREATAARKADEQILALDPHDIDAHLILGLNQYVVASLPFYMRALGFLGGFHGDREGGIRQLELVASQGSRNRYDAEVLLAVIYRREHAAQKAIPLLEDLATRFPRNYIFRFEQVQMYSDMGDKQSALRVLAEIERLRCAKSPGYAGLLPEKIQYMKGNLLFWYGDLDAALADLTQATGKAGDLDLNTAVLAWLRLGQVYDLKGNHQAALGPYREAIKTAPKSEAAAEAKGYISHPYHRKRADS
ncbi:MAG TPA: tRNA epoxyqueuosine(34) reductase QueG [Bryobacteraceae bacterium]